MDWQAEQAADLARIEQERRQFAQQAAKAVADLVQRGVALPGKKPPAVELVTCPQCSGRYWEVENCRFCGGVGMIERPVKK